MIQRRQVLCIQIRIGRFGKVWDSSVDQELFGSVWDNIAEKDAGGESSEHPYDPMAEHYTSE